MGITKKNLSNIEIQEKAASLKKMEIASKYIFHLQSDSRGIDEMDRNIHLTLPGFLFCFMHLFVCI